MSRYAIRTLVLRSGERLPVLFDRLAGEPLFEPTLYSLTELRARNLASNTIDQALRAIMVLHIFLNLRDIDFGQRLSNGNLLELGEIEELVRICRLPMKKLTTMAEGNSFDRSAPSNSLSMEKYRMRQRAAEKTTDPRSAANRIRHIRNYLTWRVADRLSKRDFDQQMFVGLESAGNRMSAALTARIRSPASRSTIVQREGATPQALSRLMEVIDPASPDNPWHGKFAKERNALMIRWMLALGLRRGEMLGVRISDINFCDNTVHIVRRADDPNDPRQYQPNAKTRDRVMPMSDGLVQLTQNFIINFRRGRMAGLTHDFLIVAAGTGAPLSSVGVNKIFDVLRANCPELPNDMVPHVLRHSWNDQFSEVMDKNNISEESENKMRSYLMGWSETSGTALVYTRRHVRKKARDVSLKMQADMIQGSKNGK